MPSRFVQAKWLALSIQQGSWERSAVAKRLTRALPSDGPDLDKLCARLILHFDESGSPDAESLVSFLLREPLLQPVFDSECIRGPLLDPPVMSQRHDRLITFPLPELATSHDVGLWLCLFDRELAWFADSRSQQHRVTEEKLHHYYYSWVPKRAGGFRLIEIPKSRLKRIQRTILGNILNRVPPHPSAHGFTRGHSIKSFAAPHIGQQAVLRLDLKDFFHSVPAPRVGALFRRLGYPPKISRLLQGFCTNSVSPALAGNRFSDLTSSDRKRLESKHLPQGAPTSAPLANLCAWRLDCRLKGVADRYGYQYTRYADDIAFSGASSLARRADFIEALVGSIVIDEGFELNHRKTRLRQASQRQRLAGVVVNEKTNISRADWDRLKATLYNCIKHGPESQNHDKLPDFRAHLEGRVAHVTWLNPARGEKLRSMLNRIAW